MSVSRFKLYIYHDANYIAGRFAPVVNDAEVKTAANALRARANAIAGRKNLTVPKTGEDELEALLDIVSKCKAIERFNTVVNDAQITSLNEDVLTETMSRLADLGF